MVGIGHTPNDVTIAAMNDVLNGNVERVTSASHLHEQIMGGYVADKRLRDAAPALLDALRYCAESPMSGWTIAQGHARAAIAKATGQ